jgi:hypothetical protein
MNKPGLANREKPDAPNSFRLNIMFNSFARGRSLEMHASDADRHKPYRSYAAGDDLLQE